MKRVGQLFREKLVNEIKDGFNNHSSIFLLSYSQLSGQDINDFRKNLNKAGANVCASKNTIARLALKDVRQESLAEKISGQTAFVWSNEDSAAVSKILIDFEKEFEGVIVQGGLLDGKILDQSDIKRLSDLPSREVLLSQLLGTIQAPLTRLIGAFNAKSRDLLSILKQLGEQKGGN